MCWNSGRATRNSRQCYEHICRKSNCRMARGHWKSAAALARSVRALVESLNLEVTGVDPSPIFVARAQELGKHLPGLTFIQGDGRSLTLRDASFDLVVFHTTLCHIPNPEVGASRSPSGTSSGRLAGCIRWRLHDDDGGDQ